MTMAHVQQQQQQQPIMDADMKLYDPQTMPLHDMTCMLLLTTEDKEYCDTHGKPYGLPEPINWYDEHQCEYIASITNKRCRRKARYKTIGGSLVCKIHMDTRPDDNIPLLQCSITPTREICEDNTESVVMCQKWLHTLGTTGNVMWTNIKKRQTIHLIDGTRNIAIDYYFRNTKRKGLTFIPKSATSTIECVFADARSSALSIDNLIKGSLYYGYRKIDFLNSQSTTTKIFMSNRHRLSTHPNPYAINPFSVDSTTNERLLPTAFVWQRKNFEIQVHSAEVSRGYACKLMQNYMLSSNTTPFRRLEQDVKNGLSVNICGHNLQDIPHYSEDDDTGSNLRARYNDVYFNFSSEVVLYVMLTYPAHLWPWADVIID